MRQEASQKEQYIESLFAPEDESLSAIFHDLRKDEAHMQISPIEGKILHTLAKMISARKIVEIGTLAGYSSIWMARALSDKGKLYTIEKDHTKVLRILKNFEECGVSEKVELLSGEAASALPELNAYGPFDMVFIDADKASYPKYLDWAEEHIRPGGLIVGDNTFLFGAVYDENNNAKPETIKAMQEFNSRLANPDKYTSIILPTGEGMTVAVKNF